MVLSPISRFCYWSFIYYLFISLSFIWRQVLLGIKVDSTPFSPPSSTPILNFALYTPTPHLPPPPLWANALPSSCPPPSPKGPGQLSSSQSRITIILTPLPTGPFSFRLTHQSLRFRYQVSKCEARLKLELKIWQSLFPVSTCKGIWHLDPFHHWRWMRFLELYLDHNFEIRPHQWNAESGSTLAVVAGDSVYLPPFKELNIHF